MPKIYIVGSVNMDLVVRTEEMPKRGQTVTGLGFMQNPGGKGANQAVACAKLGAEAYMVGCVGEAYGGELLAALRGYGVKTDFVDRTEGPSGLAVIVVEGGDNRIILERGANGKVTEALIDRALATAEAGDYLLTQLEIDPALVRYALKRGKEKGMVTVLNPAPAARLEGDVLTYVDYFTPNQTEAEFYAGVYPEDALSIGKCAALLSDMGATNVLITLGKRGSVFVGGEGEIVRCRAYPAEAVDTTAAGDTFVAAFAVRRAEGAEPEDAMAFAGRAAAITVARVGAQQSIPSRAEVEALP